MRERNVSILEGSKYNDKKERFENRRQSFFLTTADIDAAAAAGLLGVSGPRRIRSTGTSVNSPSASKNESPNNSVVGAASNSGSVVVETVQEAVAEAAIVSPASSVTTTPSVTGLRRHTIAKSRSLDSGVNRMPFFPVAEEDCYAPMQDNSSTNFSTPIHNTANNPQDDYGSTSHANNGSGPRVNFSPELGSMKNATFLRRAGRAQSMLVRPVSRSCTDLPAIVDEKPVRTTVLCESRIGCGSVYFHVMLIILILSFCYLPTAFRCGGPH